MICFDQNLHRPTTVEPARFRSMFSMILHLQMYKCRAPRRLRQFAVFHRHSGVKFRCHWTENNWSLMTAPSSMIRTGFYQSDIYKHTLYISYTWILSTCILYVCIYIHTSITFAFTQSLPRWPLAAIRCWCGCLDCGHPPANHARPGPSCHRLLRPCKYQHLSLQICCIQKFVWVNL